MDSGLKHWRKFDPRRWVIYFVLGLAFGIYYGYHILWSSAKRWLLTKRPEKED